MNRSSTTPSQPETMRMTHHILTKAELAGSPGQSVGVSDWNWGRINLADRPGRSVGQSVWNWGRINFDDISFRLEDEPASVQSQDAIFQMSPPEEPETTRISSREAADNNDISLRLEGEPASVQSQHANFQSVQRAGLRILTREVLNSFKDSSGVIELNDVRAWQGLEPIERAPVQSQHAKIRRVLTLEELNSFRDSSGVIEINDIRASQGLEPLVPYGPSLSNQSKGLSTGLSGQTISKYLKRVSANKIRAQGIDGDPKICAVCHDDVCGQKRKVAILDECGHEFHYRCLKKWLRWKNICPLCRRTAIYILKDR